MAGGRLRPRAPPRGGAASAARGVFLSFDLRFARSRSNAFGELLRMCRYRSATFRSDGLWKSRFLRFLPWGPSRARVVLQPRHEGCVRLGLGARRPPRAPAPRAARRRRCPGDSPALPPRPPQRGERVVLVGILRGRRRRGLLARFIIRDEAGHRLGGVRGGAGVLRLLGGANSCALHGCALRAGKSKRAAR